MAYDSLKPPSLSAPRLTAPRLTAPRLKAPRLQAPGKIYVSKNKYKFPERKHIVSIGDLIGGDPISGTRQRQEALEDAGLDALKYVPVLNLIAGLGVTLDERFIHPILEGKPGVAFINGLETAGKSLDLFANPIKSLLPWTGGGTTQDLLKSIGWLEGEYRTDYNFNTGNWALDVAGEMLSDPLTYVTLGTDTLAKKPISSIAQSTTEIVKKAAKSNSDDIARHFINVVKEDVVSGNNEIMETIAKSLQAGKKQIELQLKDIPKGTYTYKKFKEAIAAYSDVLKPDKWLQLTDEISALRNSELYQYYTKLKNINKFGKKVQGGLINATTLMAPSWGVPKILKDTGKLDSMFSSMVNSMTVKLKDYIIERPTSTLTNKTEFIDHFISADAYARYKKTYDNFEMVFKNYKLNRDILTGLWRKLWLDAPMKDRDVDIINAKFIDELLKLVPELRDTWENVQEKAVGLLPNFVADVAEVAVPNDFVAWIKKNLNKKDIKALVNATKNTALTQLTARNMLAYEYKKQIDIDMAKFFKSSGRAGIEKYKGTKVIRYIDERLTTIGKKHYGLANLETFLNELNQQSPQQYQNVVAVLDLMGVDLNNYKEVNDLYKSIKAGKTHLGRKLKQVLSNSKKGALFESGQDLFKMTSEPPKLVVSKRNVLARSGEENAKLIEDRVKQDYIATQLVNQFKDQSEGNYRQNIEEIQNLVNIASEETHSTSGLLGTPDLGFQKNPRKIQERIDEEIIDPVHALLYKYDISFSDIEQRFEDFWQANGAPMEFMRVKRLVERFKQDLKDYLKTDPDTGLKTRKVSEAGLNGILNILTKDITSTVDVKSVPKEYYTIQDKDRFYEELDYYFGKYAGLDEEDIPSNLIKYFADYELDPTDPAGIKLQWDRLKRAVAVWHREVQNYELEQYPQHVVQFVRNLHNYLQTEVAEKSQTNLLDLASAYSTAYYMQLTAQARTDLVYQQMLINFGGKDIMASNTKYGADDIFINLITDRDSEYRKALESELKAMVNDTDPIISTAGNYLIGTLSRIDGMCAMQWLMNQQFVPNYLPKKFNNAISTLIHDAIYNRHSRQLTALIEDPSELVDEVMSIFLQYNHNKGDNAAVWPRWELYKAVAEYFELQSDPKRVEEICNEIIDSTRKNITMQISKYLDALRSIQEWSDMDVRLYYSIAGPDVDLIKSLDFVGQQYKDIRAWLVSRQTDLIQTNEERIQDLVHEPYTKLNQLNRAIAGIKTRTEFNKAEVLDEFIRKMSSTIAKEDIIPARRSDRIRYFNSMANAGIGTMNTQIDYAVNRTLSYALMDAFNNIDLVNDSLAGTDKHIDVGLMDKLRADVQYISAHRLNNLIKDETSCVNAFDYAFTNGLIGFKKLINGDFVKEHFLSPELYFPNMPTEDYQLLYGTLEQYINRFKSIRYENVLQSRWYIKETRKALAQFYKNYVTTYGPKDPVTYFMKLKLSDADVLAWDAFTKNSKINRINPNKYASLKKRIMIYDNFSRPEKEIYKNPMDSAEAVDALKSFANPYYAINKMNALEEQGPFADTEELVDLVGNTVLEEIDYVTAGATLPLTQRMKDVESLQKYSWYYDNYIRNNVSSVRRLERILQLERNTDKVLMSLDFSKLSANEIETLTNNHIYKNTPMNNRTVLSFMKRERDTGKLLNVKSYTIPQLRSYIDDHETGGLFLVNERGYVNSLDRAKLAKSGLSVIEYAPGIDLIIADDSVQPHVDYKYKIPKYIFPKQQRVITNLFEKNSNLFNDSLPAEFNTGETIETSDLAFLFKTPKVIKWIEEHYPDQDVDEVIAKISKASQRKGRIPNAVILGSTNALNKFVETMKDTYAENNVNILKRFNKGTITRSAIAGTFSMLYEKDKLRKYLEIFFNEDYAINNKIWSKALEGASDKELRDLFKQYNYSAAVLKTDKNGDPIVKQIYINNRHDLEFAQQHNAVILPYDTFRSVSLVINERKGTNNFLNFYKGAVTGFYKSIFLSTLGYLFRNEVDSALYKNAASTYGLKSIKQNFENQNLARKLLSFYNDVQKKAIATTDNNTMNERVLQAELKKLTPDMRRIYKFVDMFINSSLSGGYTQALEDLMMRYNLMNNPTGTDLWSQLGKFINDVASSDIAPMKHVNAVNNVIEQTARLGNLLTQMQNGTEFSKAIMTGIETHFDYKLKTNLLQLAEQLFWFSTFPINNLNYYLNEGITKNPEMLYLLMDAQEASWNSQGYTWDDVRNNSFYAYNAMVGNLRFNFLGRDVLLKTGSSVYDFFSLLFDPAGELADRLNPFLSVALGLEPVNALNPFDGAANRVRSLSRRIRHMQEGTAPKYLSGSFVPSIYTLIPHNETFYKKYKNNYQPKGKTWTTYPRRPHKVYHHPMKNYTAKTYRYYWGRSKNYHLPLTKSLSNQPYWYHRNYYSMRKERQANRKLRQTIIHIR